MEEMKNKFLIYLILLLVNLSLYSDSDDHLDLSKIDKIFYGIKNFTIDDETELNNTLYGQDGLYNALFNFNDSSNINKLKNILNKIDDNNLLGNAIANSFLMLKVSHEINDNLLNLLKEFDNKQIIKKIIELREILPYRINSEFNLSSKLKRHDLKYNISMILPDADWQSSGAFIIIKPGLFAGNTDYAALIMISKEFIFKTDLSSIKSKSVTQSIWT
jgi:hypothetical protein